MQKKLILFVLVFSLFFLTGCTNSVRKADLEGKIVFCNLDGRSYLMDLSTGKMKRIPIKEAYNSALSPDQKKIAYNNYKGLWTANIDGSEQRLLTDKGMIANRPSRSQPIAWSPDGKRIAFYSGGTYGIYAKVQSAVKGTYIIDADGENEIFITDAYENSEWPRSKMLSDLFKKISPDEKKVIFIRGEKAPYYRDFNDWVENIYIADVSGDKGICLTPIEEEKERPKEKYTCWGIQWSPDGKKIFYFRRMEKWMETQYMYRRYFRFIFPYSLIMMNPDGSKKTVVQRFRYYRI